MPCSWNFWSAIWFCCAMCRTACPPSPRARAARCTKDVGEHARVQHHVASVIALVVSARCAGWQSWVNLCPHVRRREARASVALLSASGGGAAHRVVMLNGERQPLRERGTKLGRGEAVLREVEGESGEQPTASRIDRFASRRSSPFSARRRPGTTPS